MKRAIIIGATSGIGEEVAKLLIQQGWHIGIAGRREEALEKLQATAPGQIEIQRLDVTDPDAPTLLETLIRKLGGMDLFFLSSGIGSQNPDLKPEIELNTARTNVEGFTRMVTAAFNHFKTQGGGHIAVISSIAGTKGLGIAPAMSEFFLHIEILDKVIVECINLYAIMVVNEIKNSLPHPLSPQYKIHQYAPCVSGHASTDRFHRLYTR